MSAEYLWFVTGYALVLTIASLVVFTQRGQAFVLRSMQRLGRFLGVGAWGLLHTFGYRADTGRLSASERAELAESYIASAEAQTLASARVTVWVLISGCVVTAVAGIVISGLLPAYVVAGDWSYATYAQISGWLILLNVAGGLAMGAGLVWWLIVRTMNLNRSEGCAVTRDLVLAAQGSELDPEMTMRIATGSYPRLSGLLSDVA